ncbi:MAG: thiol reductant ABC exporter subunit CydD [Vicinamibacteria bacterium]|nr:thiol reductant ABC exporter subunit CydD [Vicinamibacteria bacterium]
MWPREAAARRALLGAVGAGLLGGLLAIGQAFGLSRLIDGVFLRGADLAASAGLLAVLVGLAFARAAAGAVGDVCAQGLATRTKVRLRARLAQQLVALGPRFSSGERAGELVRTATAGVETIDPALSQALPQALLAALVPLAIVAAVAVADPLSALVLFVTLPLIPLFTALIGSLAAARTAEQWSTVGRLSARLLDGLQGLPTLVALGRADDYAGEIAATAERLRVATMRVLRVAFLSGLALELLATVGTALVAVQVGLRLLHEHVEFAPALFVLLLTPEFYKPLRALGAAFHAAMPARDAGQRLFAILDNGFQRRDEPGAGPMGATSRTELLRPQTPTGFRAEHGAVPPEESLAIAFEDVAFAYPGGRAALCGASFHVPAGEVTALAGPSGAGKSTAAALLLRFFEPDTGTITVGGHPLSSFDAEAWRERIAWVPQRPHLFFGTARENLLLARPAASSEQLERAAALARFDEVVGELPQGWDTPLGEAGARLSSGQAQRLALARAFLKDAPLVILDEPTAHLDAALQASLARSIRALCDGRTVLLIAHRLETLRQADRVVLLAHGRVVEHGAPAELRAAGGAFARLWAEAPA